MHYIDSYDYLFTFVSINHKKTNYIMKRHYLLSLCFMLILSVNTFAQENYANWVRSIEAEHRNTNFNNILSDGEFIYANGSYIGTGNFLGSVLPYDLSNNIILAKTDLEGNKIWVSTLHGEGIDGFYDMSFDHEGNIVAAGWTSSSGEMLFNGEVVMPAIQGEFANRGLVMKISKSTGKMMWVKSWESADYSKANAARMTTDTEGNTYAAGYYRNTFNIDGDNFPYSFASGDAMFLLKLNPQGEMVWTQHFEGKEAGSWALIKSMQANENGLYLGFDYHKPYVLNSEPLSYEGDYYWNCIAKINKNTGVVEKHFSYGSPTGGQGITQLKLDTDKNIIVSGFFTSDSNYKIGNIALNGYGYDDGYVAKLNANLDVVWAKQIGSTSVDRAFNVNVLHNNIIIGGGFHNSADLMYNNEIVVENHTPSSLSMFVLNIDSDGAFKKVYALHGEDENSTLSNNTVAVLEDGTMYSGGTFMGGVQFSDEIYLNSSEHNTGFFMKWEDKFLAVDNPTQLATLSIYPNPVADALHIRSTNSEKVDINIFDATGRQVYQNKVNAPSQLNLSFLSSGIYMVRIVSGKTAKTFKIIKK